MGKMRFRIHLSSFILHPSSFILMKWGGCYEPFGARTHRIEVVRGKAPVTDATQIAPQAARRRQVFGRRARGRGLERFMESSGGPPDKESELLVKAGDGRGGGMDS